MNIDTAYRRNRWMSSLGVRVVTIVDLMTICRHMFIRLRLTRVPERAAVVPGTDGRKMSKSAGNTIELFSTDAEVHQRIMGIRTDSAPLESPKPIDNALYGLLGIMAPPGEFAQLDASWK